LPSVSVADQEQQHDHQLQQYRFAQSQQSQFNDPAIMSASLGMPHMSAQEALGNAQQVFLPPGLAYPPGLKNNVANDGEHSSLLFLRGRQPVFGGPSAVPWARPILPGFTPVVHE
jgi:hypothetical protein